MKSKTQEIPKEAAIDSSMEKKSSPAAAVGNGNAGSDSTSFMEQAKAAIEPLPSPQTGSVSSGGIGIGVSVPNGTAIRAPGAFAEGGAPPNFNPTANGPTTASLSATDAVAITNLAESASTSLVHARAVPEDEQANGLERAEPVNMAGPPQPTSQKVFGRQTAVLGAVWAFFLLGGILAIVAVALSNNNEDNIVTKESTEAPISIAGGMITPEEYLWAELPDFTRHKIILTDDDTAATTEVDSSSQTQAFQWLIQDPHLQEYPSFRLWQRFALAALYFGTQGTWWDKNTNWLSYEHHECDWFADEKFQIAGPPELADSPCGDPNVQASRSRSGSDSNSTTRAEVYHRLWLSSHNLDGILPTEEIYGMLTHLESINFYNNTKLTGAAMHHRMGGLTNLSMVSFAATGLSGTIPSEIGLSSKLQVIYMSKTKKLSSSVTAPVSNNGLFSGTLPTELGLLTDLKHLSYSFNNVTGTLPSEMLSLNNLQLLQIPGNNMKGSLPTEIGKTNLNYLWAYDNSFTGVIPTELGLLTNLIYVHLYHNNLHGEIPTELASLTATKELILTGNSLTSSVPSELGLLSFLRILYLSENPLTGTLPLELYNLSQIEALDIEDTSIQFSDTMAIPQHFQEAMAINTSFYHYYYECDRWFPCRD